MNLAGKYFLIIAISLIAAVPLQAQISGCTDPQASNYNSLATVNDGSCSYPVTNLSLTTLTNISTPLLDENSGLEFINNDLWTHNDGGSSNSIYRIDTVSATVLQTVQVSNAGNVDWEDITSNKDYLFIGDFGNNYGNRTNLKIYRVAKTDLSSAATTVVADTISFSYSDQTSFATATNNNNFDCEAVIFLNDSIHLFSKNWVDKQCKHYVLPAVPGTYVAQLRETFNAGCLITGAAVQNGGVLALTGYDNTGTAPVYLWMLYDYKNGFLFNGNKRRFNLSSAIVNGQVEGVDFRNGAYGYISNERFQQFIFNIPPVLRSFNLASYLPSKFVYPKPKATFTSSSQVVCKSSYITFTDQSENDATTWKWAFQGGSPKTSTLKNPVVKYSTPGTYSVTLIATNATGSDTLVKTNFITVHALPEATVTQSADNFCTGGSVLLSANSGSNLSYQWKKNSSLITGETSISYSAIATANYRVIVTDTNGCIATSPAVSVTGPPSTTITVTGSLNVCNGDSVKLEAPSTTGYTFQWQKNSANISGATSRTLYAKTVGTYRVIVTNFFGCAKTSGTKKATTNCRLANETFFEKPVVKIYPNPSSEKFIFNLDGEEKFSLLITDISGKSIAVYDSLYAQDQFEFGEELKPGIYFAEFIFADRKEIFKIIKTEGR